VYGRDGAVEAGTYLPRSTVSIATGLRLSPSRPWKHFGACVPAGAKSGRKRAPIEVGPRGRYGAEVGGRCDLGLMGAE
jgi:hypothetical protein